MHKTTDKLPAVTPPQPEEYLPSTIQKAVLGIGFKHPLTIYPVALGIGSAVIGWLFNWPLFWFLSLGLGFAGSLWAVVTIFFRHEILGSKYLYHLNQKQKQYEHYLIRQIETGLKECCSVTQFEPIAVQGTEQLNNIQVKFTNIKELLELKLRSSEITFGRFLGAAEQVSLSVLDNLKNVANVLKSAGSIQPEYIKERLKAIAAIKKKSPEDNDQETSLRQRLELWQTQLGKAQRLIAANETAMTEMEKISAAIAEWQTDRRFASTDFETAIERLNELAQQAHEYNT